MPESSHQIIGEDDQEAIRAQLDRILRSSAFQQSPRRQKFLEYLVTETLAGRGERLKGYTVAVEVFERPETFDPLLDPIVRIEAGRLREKLRDYYEHAGVNDPIVINLPKGTYTPSIVFRPTTGGGEQPAVRSEDAPVTSIAAAQTSASAQGASVWLGTMLQWPVLISLLALALVVSATSVWHHRRPVAVPATAEADGTAARPKGPTIVVLPFANLSGDPQQQYFSDRLTEDIRAELARGHDFFVLAFNAKTNAAGQPADAAKIGRELKANYILEGSVRRSGDRLRVTAELVDSQSGQHVWADRFDREMASLLLVQEEVVGEIVSKLTGGYGVINVAESRSAKRKTAQEIEAYDMVLRAQDVMRPEWSRTTFKAAKDMLRQAIALDPDNSRALRELAYLTEIGWVFRFDDTPIDRQELAAQATRSVQLEPTDARARMVAAAAYFWTKQLDLFEHEAKKALALAPYDAEILAAIGGMIATSSNRTRGVALVEKANALNAYAASGWYESTIAVDAYLKGDYQRALSMLRRSPDQGAFYIYVEYIPIYGQLGLKDEAQKTWRKLLEVEPRASADTIRDWFRLWDMHETEIARFMDGVEKSGVTVTRSE